MAKNSPYVRSIALTGLPTFIEKCGGNPAELFSTVGLSLSDIQKEKTFISWPKACDLLELCATALDEPQFGIKWADELSDDFPNSGPIIFAAALVPNARQLLGISIIYQKTHSNGMTIEFVEDTTSEHANYILHLHPMTPACRQYVEHITATIIRMTKQFLHDVNYLEIHFQHSPLREIDFYEKKFNCNVIFNSSQFKIVGKNSDLDKPINGPLRTTRLNGSLSFLQPFLKKFLDRRLKKVRHSETPITNSIEEILPSIFGINKSDIDSIATALGLSTKKMQRLLKTEGSNFSAIRDQTRQQMTKRLFRESDVSISTIAHALDYKSPEAFNTACKRWVGESPREYRASLKSKGY